jgi:hypothetical protein
MAERISRTPQRNLQCGDLAPPHVIPETCDPQPRQERWVERRWDHWRAERRPSDDDDEILIFRERRRAPEERPWYREPERWIESINSF